MSGRYLRYNFLSTSRANLDRDNLIVEMDGSGWEGIKVQVLTQSAARLRLYLNNNVSYMLLPFNGEFELLDFAVGYIKIEIETTGPDDDSAEVQVVFVR